MKIGNTQFTLSNSPCRYSALIVGSIFTQNVPDEILKNVTGQIRQVQAIPKRLDEYTAEERAEFPRLFEW